MTDLEFVERSKLVDYEWDNRTKQWKRPEVDRALLRELSQRSTSNGLLRVGYFMLLLTAGALATVWISRYSIPAAVPFLYVYYFFYGFWVAIGHELQHKTVFGKNADRLSEIFFFFVQTLMWNSPRYARISHKLHHRYTMVRGIDPETDWPEVITSSWLKRHLGWLVLRVLVVGAIWELGKSVALQIRRAAGAKDRMMRDHCSEEDIKVIRIESAAILLIHLAVAATAAVFGVWELIAFFTLAWHIGAPMEELWHATKHIGRPYNVNDHRLNTRSIRVSPFIRSFFWGLDDHVDHHLYPIVPSRNLPRLHTVLKDRLPEPDNIIGCWNEMFAIAKVKDFDPERELKSVK